MSDQNQLSNGANYVPGLAFRHAMAHETPIYLHHDAHGCYAISPSSKAPTRDELIAGHMRIETIVLGKRGADGIEPVLSRGYPTIEQATKWVDAALGRRATEQEAA